MAAIKPAAWQPAAGTGRLTTRAVQLAANVRLPAAVIPIDEAGVPPAVAEAGKEIINGFYRELQAYAEDELSHPDHQTVDATSGDETTIIPVSAATDRIRHWADEQFRAQYGNEKFIQQTHHSAVEVRLPLSP